MIADWVILSSMVLSHGSQEGEAVENESRIMAVELSLDNLPRRHPAASLTTSPLRDRRGDHLGVGDPLCFRRNQHDGGMPHCGQEHGLEDYQINGGGTIGGDDLGRIRPIPVPCGQSAFRPHRAPPTPARPVPQARPDNSPLE